MSNHFIKLSTVGILLTTLFSACLPLKDTIQDTNIDETDGLQITMKDAYQGVKDGNVEWVPLPENSAYITVEICVENPLATDQSVQWQDVFITTEGHEYIFPVALGYDQAEAFSWLLPIAEPVGGKRITHEYYFFLIQNNEIMKIPPYQSLGCSTSYQFKSLALLFIVRNDIASQSFILHFLEGEIGFTARRNLTISESVKWGIGLGLFLILVILTVIMIRKKISRAQASLSPKRDQNDSQGDL